MRVLRIACLLVLGLVFAMAAVPKILSPQEFAVAIFRYQILPYALINGMAIYMPWLEITCAAALPFARTRRAAALLILAMLAVFTVAIALSIARGINIACGCFSVEAGGSHVGWLNLARNVALMAAAVLVLRAPEAKGTQRREAR